MAKRSSVILPYRCPRCERPGDGKVDKKGSKLFPCGTSIDKAGAYLELGHACQYSGTTRFVVGKVTE